MFVYGDADSPEDRLGEGGVLLFGEDLGRAGLGYGVDVFDAEELAKIFIDGQLRAAVHTVDGCAE